MATATRNPCGTWEQAVERAAKYANAHGGDIVAAQRFLARAGWGGSTFGVEYVGIPDADRQAAYLNAGDTYSLTVLHDGERGCFVSTWGDWYEQAEQEHEQAEGVIRCGYCGEFTEHAEGVEWRDVRCTSCGRNVADGTPMDEPSDDD